MSQGSDLRERQAVFVDTTGKRRRLVRNAGIAVGCLLVAYLVMVGFGLATGSSMNLTPWPDVRPSHHAALPGERGLPPRRASSRPGDIRSASPAARRTNAPGARATPTSMTTPSTSPSTTPAPSATAGQPGKGRAYGRTKSPRPRKP